ncbi:MAG: hypothetical protein FWG27_08580 [Treponema sp.]|jgi:hypothetical protein|nr:hypothetical protein [Treponema sp.]
MKTIENGWPGGGVLYEAASPLLLAVLVPHRDCLPALNACRQHLFAAGIDGAYSFPAAAPLALLKRPLEPGELKSAASELRKLLGNIKIVSSGQGECSGFAGHPSGEVRFFGPLLELPLPVFSADAVLQRWEKPILAPAILAPGESSLQEVMENDPQRYAGLHKQGGSAWLPRAAALANLTLWPLLPSAKASTDFSFFEKNYSFTWKMGPLHWLPNPNKKKRMNHNHG